MIRVENVTRRYGSLTAVDAASFTIEAGEVVGFLGPNGAGKSTMLKMLSTYLPPSAGRITIAGHDSVRDALDARRNLGYLPEHNALFESMRVDRFLAFMAKVRGLERADRASRAEWVVQACGLQSVLAKRIKECSKGYRQRIGLAAALIHDPPVILLDEPTHGLDPLQVIAFREFIEELRAGRAILFSSHILAEVVAITDRLLVIQHGRLVLDAQVADLRRQAQETDSSLEQIVLSAVRSAEVAVRVEP